VASNTLPSGCTIPSPQINGTISSSGNLGISAYSTVFGNSTSQFQVTNSTGSNVLNCNGSTLAVTTKNNTVDDGSGNMTIASSFTQTSGVMTCFCVCEDFVTPSLLLFHTPLYGLTSGIETLEFTSTPHSTQFTATVQTGIKTAYVASGTGTVAAISFTVPSTAWGVWMYTVSLVGVGLFPNNANSSTSYPQSILITNNSSGVAGIQNSSAPTITQNNSGLTSFSWTLSGNTLSISATKNSGQAFNVICNYQIMFCGTETDT